MDWMTTSLLVLLTGLAAGFLDSTVGSGGLISIPFLIFLGFPPHVAVATDRLGTLGQTSAALLKFWKSGKIRWNYVPIFIVLSLIGAVIGANILLTIDPKILQKIIGIVLLILLPLIFLKKEIGVVRVTVTKLRKAMGFFVYFLLSIFSGFLGIGSGATSFYNSLFNFGFTFIEANATGIIPWFLLSLISLIIFNQNGIVDYRNGIFLFIGMVIGGYFGAHVALKKGELWIKRLFVLVVIISSIRLLFFS